MCENHTYNKYNSQITIDRELWIKLCQSYHMLQSLYNVGVDKWKVMHKQYPFNIV